MVGKKKPLLKWSRCASFSVLEKSMAANFSSEKFGEEHWNLFSVRYVIAHSSLIFSSLSVQASSGSQHIRWA
jgi:hypothetical protein